jgi:hypothetical protein
MPCLVLGFFVFTCRSLGCVVIGCTLVAHAKGYVFTRKQGIFVTPLTLGGGVAGGRGIFHSIQTKCNFVNDYKGSR